MNSSEGHSYLAPQSELEANEKRPDKAYGFLLGVSILPLFVSLHFQTIYTDVLGERAYLPLSTRFLLGTVWIWPILSAGLICLVAYLGGFMNRKSISKLHAGLLLTFIFSAAVAMIFFAILAFLWPFVRIVGLD